ncbi:MAG: DNRLRE domain-containing protein [Kofleriaceae bacterium]
MRGVALAVVLAVGAGCNSLLGIEDLTLIDAVPPDAQATYVVREGLAGYSMTRDTFISSVEPTTVHSDDVDLHWTTMNNVHTLLRFDDLFGAGGVPPGASINMATLEVTVVEAGAMAQLYEPLVDWDEATTYNTLGPTPGVFPPEDRGRQVPDILDTSALGTAIVNVTQSVADWAANPSTNKGWLFVPLSASLARVASSDDADENNRPKLTVVIVP